MTKILYFAQLAEELEETGEEITLPEVVRDVRGLLKMLRMKGPEYEQWLQDDRVQVTVNRAFVDLDSPISDGDEIGIMAVRR
jgi:molybdopterin synthase sulfur carrier subunit